MYVVLKNLLFLAGALLNSLIVRYCRLPLPLSLITSMHGTRKLNFGAGPAALPVTVLSQFSKDLIDFKGSGVGVGEISHRTALFEEDILGEANAMVLKLSGYEKEGWRVLWMTGGGTGQFAAVPMNFWGNEGVGVYLVTGTWSEKAAEEAKKILGPERVKVIDMRVEIENVRGLNTGDIDIDTSSRVMYVYYCDNETVDGIELPHSNYFQSKLNHLDTVFIADTSSNFMSRPFPDPRGPTGIIFAGVQKNLGAAGVTIVMVKESLLGTLMPARFCPSVLDYKVTAKNNSLLNTPPVISIHLCGLVLKDLIRRFNGDLGRIDEFSKLKSQALYEAIERSGKFYSPIAKEFRSRMNVIFKPVNGDESVEKEFLKRAEAGGMIQLKGHRSVGGLRASLYNAVEMDAVHELIKLIF